MNSRLNKRKGFSIVELVISLAVITVVSVSALSIVSLSINSNANTTAKIQAQNFASDVWECFKVSESVAEFESNVSFCGGGSLDAPVTEGEYTVYTFSAQNKYLATVKVDFGELVGEQSVFEISVADKKGKEIVAFNYTKGV